MSEYITIGYIYYPIPLRVKKESVLEDKSAILPRIQETYNIFSGDIPPEERDAVLEKIIDNILLLDGKDNDIKRLLRGRPGSYSHYSRQAYIDSNCLGLPALVEHETIHLMGDTRIGHFPIKKPIVKQDAIAANILITLLDKDNILGGDALGLADSSDFQKLRLYRLLPPDLQEKIERFRIICFRIGNYGKETGEGYGLVYRLSK